MKRAKRGSKRDQTLRRMTNGWDDAHKHLSQCRVTDYYTCAQTREKKRRVKCTVHTTRRLQLIATSCERFCYNKLKNMSSTSFDSSATMKSWKMKKTNATFSSDEKGLVQVALLQIHGGDGAYL